MRLLIAFFCLTFALPALAAGQQSIVISNAWIRIPANGSDITSAYLTIRNNGARADRLISVATPVAGKADIHEMIGGSGEMKMRPLSEGLTIAAGQEIILKPGGMHLMLAGLKGKIAQDKPVPFTLNFATAGKLTVDFTPAPPGSPAPAFMAH